jgi:hypothetical protein
VPGVPGVLRHTLISKKKSSVSLCFNRLIRCAGLNVWFIVLRNTHQLLSLVNKIMSFMLWNSVNIRLYKGKILWVHEVMEDAAPGNGGTSIIQRVREVAVHL